MQLPIFSLNISHNFGGWLSLIRDDQQNTITTADVVIAAYLQPLTIADRIVAGWIAAVMQSTHKTTEVEITPEALASARAAWASTTPGIQTLVVVDS